MELPEAKKSSAADEPENKEKANWMQVREAVAARFRALFRASCHVSLHFRVDYKCNYKKIKEKNNINNNKYIWEVEFRGGKSREKYRSKVWV
jgi:hypothetical protein